MYKKEPVKGYEEYKVDTNGVVYSKKDKPLKFSLNPKGYQMAIFCVNGKTKGFGIHQIVAKQFIENDDTKNKTQVNHKDGNKENNKVENLEWVTPKENSRHSVDVLGNGIEDKNWHARSICGVDVETHKVKYKFSSLMGGARFFANGKNPRYIQNTLWKALNDRCKTYRKCIWFYEDDCKYELDNVINIIDDYKIEHGVRKLSETDIKWIRTNYIPHDNKLGTRGMAKEFNVDKSTISDIVNYKTYKDIV